MKIVYLSDDFPPTSYGGAGISTYELACAVHEAGHEVSVITTCRQAEEAGESTYEGLQVFRIQSDYLGRWRAWLSLYNPQVVSRLDELLQRLQPDAVHANNVHYYLSYHSLKLAKRYAKRVVWTARDTMSVTYDKLATSRYLEHLDPRISWLDNLRQARLHYNPFRNLIIRKYLRYADVRFSVSNALRGALEQNGICPVQTMHTGMDVTAWQVSAEAVADFKQKYGLDGKRVILFGGRLSSGKGHVQALEAARLVRESVPDAVLLVMGGQAGRDSSIVKTGWITGEEKKAAYGAADVVWVPSVYLDPLPRTVLEAMDAGKPVVGTCYGGTPEAIVDGVTGYTVDPRHVQQIADKTIDLLEHPERAAGFGHAGQERVRTHFDLDTVAAQYIERYRAP